MKIQLKYLAPYLPYRLKIKWFRNDDNSFQTSELTVSDYPFFTTKLFMPILRPLSDLNKGIYWPDGFYQMTDADDFDLQETDYNTVNDYLSRHFDVFGLIEAGLAIDANTINS